MKLKKMLQLLKYVYKKFAYINKIHDYCTILLQRIAIYVFLG